MNIPDLLTLTLCRIHKDFYIHRDNEFHRDYVALTKALTRYGYECAQRGWNLQPRAIYLDIHKLLTGVLKRRDEIKYLPAYLDEAIRSHVNTRAEEIQAEAFTSRVQRKVEHVLRGTMAVAIVEPTDTEVLGQMFSSIKRKPRQPAPPKPTIPQYEFAF